MKLYGDHAPRLAVTASRAALADSGARQRDVSPLVTVSCTGFAAPGVDIELTRQLDSSPTTQRIHVGYMGCHGAIGSLEPGKFADLAVVALPDQESNDPYELLFDSDLPVVQRWFRGAMAGPSGPTP